MRNQNRVAQGWKLMNAEELHRAEPRSFFIPPAEYRENLKPGETVKLIFELDPPRRGGPGAERMWVDVVEVEAGEYVGVLLNEPEAIDTLAPDDLVRFRAEHVAARMLADDAGYDLEGRVLVAKAIRDRDVRPGFLYRELPDPTLEGDSGWQVLLGSETDEELNTPGLAFLSELGWIAERFPELDAPFRDGRFGEWRWSGKADAFEYCGARSDDQGGQQNDE